MSGAAAGADEFIVVSSCVPWGDPFFTLDRVVLALDPPESLVSLRAVFTALACLSTRHLTNSFYRLSSTLYTFLVFALKKKTCRISQLSPSQPTVPLRPALPRSQRPRRQCPPMHRKSQAFVLPSIRGTRCPKKLWWLNPPALKVRRWKETAFAKKPKVTSLWHVRRLDPKLHTSLDPKLLPSLDPKLLPSLDPQLLPSLDPQLLPSLDP